ncbi:MRG-domain-containing protein [Xylariaceae sp. FL0804]|nr:MRG-domain-containing protein [Xylariaceae sp. FL0804]
MAPPKQERAPPYSKDEKVLSFHGDLMYDAKIMDVKVEPGKKADEAQYRIHYKGWKASWDEWVSHDRIRKLTDDNKQLASQLMANSRMRAPGSKGGKKGVKANGSEMSSARGSEERAAASSSFAGRGPRRGRDQELESYKARSHSVLRMKRVRPHPYRKEQAQESLSFAEREKMWAETAEKNDRLLNRPPRNHQYLSSRGSLRPTDNRFNFSEQSQSQKNHPKLQEKLDRGVPLTPQMEQWYKDVPLHVKSHSTAGVPHPSSLLGGDASASSAPVPAFPEAIQDKPDENANDPFQEEAFHARPSVKLIIPDILKSMLVDDWENVTKNMQLVPIPHPKPVSQIIQDYTQYELPKRIEGSSHEHLLVETLVGLKDYFERALGRLLLYRFERGQYAEIHKKWNSGDPDYKDKKISDLYGAEHLMRLIVSLPGLIAQTNMDQQSVNRLREELLLFCAWLSRNLQTYFVNTYETPTSDYIEKAKSLE